MGAGAAVPAVAIRMGLGIARPIWSKALPSRRGILLYGLAGAVAGALAGPAPCAAGAILGAALPLALAFAATWQWILLAGAFLALLVLRRGIVGTLLAAACTGALVGLLNGPIPR